MIKAEKLSFSFPEKELYHKISFTLEEGQHGVLIGSNGTGKSTLIEMIRDQEKHLFDGKLKVQPNIRIGYVSQFTSVADDSEMTVFDYLCEPFRNLETQIAKVCEDMGIVEDLEPLMERYQQLLDESMAMDSDNHESNIKKQLKVANLEKQETQQLSNLSGGEYKLVQILREMLVMPGLLIMDEPDGFLDFENLTGLERLINAYQGTMLVITHNRYLLNHCFNKILHLENGDIQEFDGTYSAYNYTLLQSKIDMQEAAAEDEAEIERNKKIVEKMRNNATKYTNAALGRTLNARVSLVKRLEERKIKEPFLEIHHPEVHLSTDYVSGHEWVVKVSDYKAEFDELLLDHVEFEIGPQEKVAVIGSNGTGKTTLLRDIYKAAKIEAGDEEQEKLAAVSFAPDTETAFLSQLQGDILTESHTVLEEFESWGIEKEEEAKDYLNRFCLNEELLYSRVGKLSGGEKNLLQLIRISIGQANLLLLDEPTSHLDVYAQEALERAIQDYNGAVLMVSHDFYTVANCMDYVLMIESGSIRKMSIRRFRQMIYENHFDKDYLEMEQKKKELEMRIQKALEDHDLDKAKKLSEDLGELVKKM